LLPICVEWYQREAKSKMAGAGRENNSDLTLEGLSGRFDVIERRVKE